MTLMQHVSNFQTFSTGQTCQKLLILIWWMHATCSGVGARSWDLIISKINALKVLSKGTCSTLMGKVHSHKRQPKE